MAGRPSKYFTHVKPNLDLIISWRQSGLTEKQICEKLNVKLSCWCLYKKQFTELADAVKESKQKLVANLKKSLFQEALGYEFEETQEYAELTRDSNGKESKPRKLKRTKVTKKARAVPNLLIFALCNLAPEEFQRVDKEAVKELEEKIGNSIKNYSDEAILKAFNALYEKSNKEKDEKNGK
jgi:nucleotidyltransferase/DNA polymerase involved in DNA repair